MSFSFNHKISFLTLNAPNTLDDFIVAIAWNESGEMIYTVFTWEMWRLRRIRWMKVKDERILASSCYLQGNILHLESFTLTPPLEKRAAYSNFIFSSYFVRMKFTRENAFFWFLRIKFCAPTFFFHLPSRHHSHKKTHRSGNYIPLRRIIIFSIFRVFDLIQ